MCNSYAAMKIVADAEKARLEFVLVELARLVLRTQNFVGINGDTKVINIAPYRNG